MKPQKVFAERKKKKRKEKRLGGEEFEDGLFKFSLSFFLSFQGYFKKRVERVKKKLRKVAKSK